MFVAAQVGENKWAVYVFDWALGQIDMAEMRVKEDLADGFGDLIAGKCIFRQIELSQWCVNFQPIDKIHPWWFRELAIFHTEGMQTIGGWDEFLYRRTVFIDAKMVHRKCREPGQVMGFEKKFKMVVRDGIVANVEMCELVFDLALIRKECIGIGDWVGLKVELFQTRTDTDDLFIVRKINHCERRIFQVLKNLVIFVDAAIGQMQLLQWGGALQKTVKTFVTCEMILVCWVVRR